MSIIVTNEITIPARRTQEVAAKFKENSESLKDFEGFEGFELCQPTDPADDRWLVITHWSDEKAYKTWVDSRSYGRSHPTEPQQEEPKNSEVRHYDVLFQMDV